MFKKNVGILIAFMLMIIMGSAIFVYHTKTDFFSNISRIIASSPADEDFSSRIDNIKSSVANLIASSEAMLAIFLKAQEGHSKLKEEELPKIKAVSSDSFFRLLSVSKNQMKEMRRELLLLSSNQEIYPDSRAGVEINRAVVDYQTILLTLNHLYVRVAHYKLLDKKVFDFSWKELDDLNLLIDKRFAINFLSRTTYGAKHLSLQEAEEISGIQLPETFLHKDIDRVVEISIPMEARQLLETMAISEPNNTFEFARLFQFNAVRETLVNTWAINRLFDRSYKYQDTPLTNIEKNREIGGVLTFRAGADRKMSSSKYYKELVSADIYHNNLLPLLDDDGYTRNKLLQASYSIFSSDGKSLLNSSAIGTPAEYQQIYKDLVFGSTQDVIPVVRDFFISQGKFVENGRFYTEEVFDTETFSGKRILKTEETFWDQQSRLLSYSFFLNDSFTPERIAERLAEDEYYWRSRAIANHVMEFIKGMKGSDEEENEIVVYSDFQLDIIEKKVYDILNRKYFARYIAKQKAKFKVILEKELDENHMVIARRKEKTKNILETIKRYDAIRASFVKQFIEEKGYTPNRITLYPADNTELFNMVGHEIQNNFAVAPLYYALEKDDDIAAVVAQFQEDIRIDYQNTATLLAWAYKRKGKLPPRDEIIKLLWQSTKKIVKRYYHEFEFNSTMAQKLQREFQEKYRVKQDNIRYLGPKYIEKIDPTYLQNGASFEDLMLEINRPPGLTAQEKREQDKRNHPGNPTKRNELASKYMFGIDPYSKNVIYFEKRMSQEEFEKQLTAWKKANKDFIAKYPPAKPVPLPVQQSTISNLPTEIHETISCLGGAPTNNSYGRFLPNPKITPIKNPSMLNQYEVEAVNKKVAELTKSDIYDITDWLHSVDEKTIRETKSKSPLDPMIYDKQNSARSLDLKYSTDPVYSNKMSKLFYTFNPIVDTSDLEELQEQMGFNQEEEAKKEGEQGPPKVFINVENENYIERIRIKDAAEALYEVFLLIGLYPHEIESGNISDTPHFSRSLHAQTFLASYYEDQAIKEQPVLGNLKLFHKKKQGRLWVRGIPLPSYIPILPKNPEIISSTAQQCPGCKQFTYIYKTPIEKMALDAISVPIRFLDNYTKNIKEDMAKANQLIHVADNTRVYIAKDRIKHELIVEEKKEIINPKSSEKIEKAIKYATNDFRRTKINWSTVTKIIESTYSKAKKVLKGNTSVLLKEVPANTRANVYEHHNPFKEGLLETIGKTDLPNFEKDKRFKFLFLLLENLRHVMINSIYNGERITKMTELDKKIFKKVAPGKYHWQKWIKKTLDALAMLIIFVVMLLPIFIFPPSGVGMMGWFVRAVPKGLKFWFNVMNLLAFVQFIGVGIGVEMLAQRLYQVPKLLEHKKVLLPAIAHTEKNPVALRNIQQDFVYSDDKQEEIYSNSTPLDTWERIKSAKDENMKAFKEEVHERQWWFVLDAAWTFGVVKEVAHGIKILKQAKAIAAAGKLKHLSLSERAAAVFPKAKFKEYIATHGHLVGRAKAAGHILANTYKLLEPISEVAAKGKKIAPLRNAATNIVSKVAGKPISSHAATDIAINTAVQSFYTNVKNLVNKKHGDGPGFWSSLDDLVRSNKNIKDSFYDDLVRLLEKDGTMEGSTLLADVKNLVSKNSSYMKKLVTATAKLMKQTEGTIFKDLGVQMKNYLTKRGNIYRAKVRNAEAGGKIERLKGVIETLTEAGHTPASIESITGFRRLVIMPYTFFQSLFHGITKSSVLSELLKSKQILSALKKAPTEAYSKFLKTRKRFGKEIKKLFIERFGKEQGGKYFKQMENPNLAEGFYESSEFASISEEFLVIQTKFQGQIGKLLNNPTDDMITHFIESCEKASISKFSSTEKIRMIDQNFAQWKEINRGNVQLARSIMKFQSIVGNQELQTIERLVAKWEKLSKLYANNPLRYENSVTTEFFKYFDQTDFMLFKNIIKESQRGSAAKQFKEIYFIESALKEHLKPLPSVERLKIKKSERPVWDATEEAEVFFKGLIDYTPPAKYKFSFEMDADHYQIWLKEINDKAQWKIFAAHPEKFDEFLKDPTLSEKAKEEAARVYDEFRNSYGTELGSAPPP